MRQISKASNLYLATCVALKTGKVSNFAVFSSFS